MILPPLFPPPKYFPSEGVLLSKAVNYISMKNIQTANDISKAQDKRMRAIVHEYVSFVKESRQIAHDTQRAAILAMGKIAGLNDGDIVEVYEDGSYKITRQEKSMKDGKAKDGSGVTLNGRTVTKEELERQREAARKQKGAKLEEAAPDTFRMRLQD